MTMHGRHGLLALLFVGAMANASDEPTSPATSSPFTGQWRVEWCDQAQPKRDCGGFTASLVQDGERVTGYGSGATLGLSRLDDCSTIEGIAVDDRAYLLIRSNRIGSIFRVEARRVGDDLSWKVEDTLVEGDGDRDIVARDDLLKPAPGNMAEIVEWCNESH